MNKFDRIFLLHTPVPLNKKHIYISQKVKRQQSDCIRNIKHFFILIISLFSLFFNFETKNFTTFALIQEDNKTKNELIFFINI